MDPTQFEFNIGIELAVGLVLGVCIPIVLFWWRLHALVKKTHDMHHEPDKYGFGTNGTNELLRVHMETEEVMQRKTLGALKYLTHTIQELSHYVRWLAKGQNGKGPPPYVREGKDPVDF